MPVEIKVGGKIMFRTAAYFLYLQCDILDSMPFLLTSWNRVTLFELYVHAFFFFFVIQD